MAESIPAAEQDNFEIFRDHLSEPVLKALVKQPQKTVKKKRSHRKSKDGKDAKGCVTKSKPVTEVSPKLNVEEDQTTAEDLGEFIDYLATIIFPSLPSDLRTLSHSKFKEDLKLHRYSLPLSPAISTSLINIIPPPAIDSLTSYALLPPAPDALDLHHFFTPLFSAYITSVTAPPPIWATTRTSACELCQRDWIPLTYHHLIPKSTHERVLKRGWHSEEMLGSVAWLCRACHSFVHRLAGNEELAKWFYTVDLIKEGGVDEDPEKREIVDSWVRWVGGVRWKSR